jgi:hypothetical protein
VFFPVLLKSRCMYIQPSLNELGNSCMLVI